jgi:hypothetical protein
MSEKVNWIRGPHGKKIVTLPDGTIITTEILEKKLNIHRVSATNRINAYIESGDESKLWSKTNRKTKYTKKPKVEVPETHYVEGDLKHYFDPHWKLLMKNI